MTLCDFDKRWFAVWEEHFPDGSISETITLNTYLCKTTFGDRILLDTSKKDWELIASVNPKEDEDCAPWLDAKIGKIVRLYDYDKIHHLFQQVKKTKKSKKIAARVPIRKYLFDVATLAKKERIPHVTYCSNDLTRLSVAEVIAEEYRRKQAKKTKKK